MQSMSLDHISEASLDLYEANNKKKILIVDDNQDQLIMFKFLFHSINDNYDYLTFSSAEKAMNYIKRVTNSKYKQIFNGSSHISLVISDYHMFPKNGLDFYKELKNLHIELPFVLFSSFMSENIQKEAKKLGITDCVEKDMDLNKTMVKLSKYFLC
ncbi:MAG: response regulator [Candidatus Hodarchaeales archaeon]